MKLLTAVFHRTLATAALVACLPMTAQAVTVTVESMGFTGNGNVIQNTLPFFGSTAEVELNWNPLANNSTALLNWLDGYSGRAAAYCGGTGCALDLRAQGGSAVTLDSFWLGGWPNTSRSIAWSVVDLANNSVIASDTPAGANVSGATGLTVNVGATSATGLRILFGPDGFSGGINDITFSASPVPEPGTWALWLAGLGGLAFAARRRARG